MAALSRPERQPSGVQHLAVGDAIVSVVNDGIHQVSFDDLVTADRAASEDAHRASFRTSPPWLTINCFVIGSGGKLALVDSGFGDKTHHTGRLVANLAAMGIAAGDIDAVLMTHMHPDHEAGLLDRDGGIVFPNAELIVHEDEVAYWRDDAALARASAEWKGDFALARATLDAYADRIRLVREGEVVPGVQAFPTPGHTPGHTAWLVESGGDALLIWGDVVHFPGIQFAHPDTSVAYDIDSTAAAAARRKLLTFAAGERLRVAGIHLDFPAFGHVVEHGSAYQFLPEVWRPTP